MEEKLYIVMPAYNERDSITGVIEQWMPILRLSGKNSRLVVVNDGSIDDTLTICQTLAKEHIQLVVLDKANGGHGSACLHAYRHAVENGADYIFQTDSDGQTVPGEFQQLWENRHNYDLCIGMRRRRQDGFSRKLVTAVLKWTLYLCFQAKVPDANTPFRLMKREFLSEALEMIPSAYPLANIIMSVYAVKAKKSVLWREITFSPRRAGVNSINIPKIIRIGWNALRDFLMLNKVIDAKLQGTTSGEAA